MSNFSQLFYFLLRNNLDSVMCTSLKYTALWTFLLMYTPIRSGFRIFPSSRNFLCALSQLISPNSKIIIRLTSLTIDQFSLFLNFIKMELYRIYSFVSGSFFLLCSTFHCMNLPTIHRANLLINIWIVSRLGIL